MPPAGATLVRAKTNVNALDLSGQVFKNFQVWTPKCPAVVANPEMCFAKCLVLPGSTEKVLKCKQVEPADPSEKEFDVPAAHAYNCNSSIDPLLYPDIGMIPHSNEAAALDFLRQRYMQGQIYSEARPLLVAINPFKNLNNATDKIIAEYRDAKDVDKLPPHVFAIARTALENLHTLCKSQTVIVSGESGAGKTEATKQVMRYFAAAQCGSIDTRIQTAVLAANPVLEAFGNAKTIRNNNSSRFGRFMMLQVAKGGGIEFGTVRNFLLEKSRILTQGADERSYHIFYQLLKGASPEQRKLFKLKKISEYKFMNAKCLDAPGVNDLEEWTQVQKSLERMQLAPDEINSTFSIISGVLALGNVVISKVAKHGLPDAAELDTKNQQLLAEACELLFLDTAKVQECLLVKIQKAGNQEIRGVWKQPEAVMLKDSLAKAMYDKLFDWIVKRLNTMIEPPEPFKHFMAMLDIFGFEVFDKNSLEQLFINITNEMLQKNFIDTVFERETKLYREEGISSADLVWTTNQEVIDMLVKKQGSVMAALEDQCLASGTDAQFLSSVHTQLKNCPKLIRAKVNANNSFAILHTIGPISYEINGFLFKNKDILRAELVEVIQQSENSVAAGSFDGVVVSKGKLAKGQLIGSQFMAQLNELVTLINSTEPHFIRCVKPNESKTPLKFVPGRVLTQMTSLSILEAIQLRNLGYSYRRPFDEFVLQYRFINLGVANDTSLEPRKAAEQMLNSANIKEGWQLGKTMLFLKAEVTKELVKKQREALAGWAPLVDVLEAMILKLKYRRAYDEAVAGLVRVQSYCRQKLQGRIKAPHHSVNVAGWH